MQLSPIIASQSRAICTEAQNYQNCDLVKNMGKMPKMAKTMPHYSSFELTKRPKKFETILGTSSFCPALTKLALDLHVNLAMSVCGLYGVRSFFFKALFV